MIRALVCDLDGTLFLGHGETVFDLPERTRKALLALKEEGIALMINSGRMLSFGQKLLEQYGFTDIVSSGFNGASATDQGICVWEYPVERSAVIQALHILVDAAVPYRTVQIQTFSGTRVFSDPQSADAAHYRRQAAQLHTGTISPLNIDAFLKEPSACAIGKLSIRFQRDEEAYRAMKLLQETLSLCNVTMSDRNLVDVISDRADKGNLCRYLIEKRNFKTDEIAAAGDGLNDIPMFEAGGLRFAMRSGSGELRKRADFTVRDVCECAERILNRKIGD